MHDLRVRFGAILALALLPLLVFAMVQSYFDYRRDSADRRVLLTTSAVNAASEIVDTLDNAKAILRVVTNTIGNKSECDADLDDIIQAVPRLDYLAITDNEGEYICRANNVSGAALKYEFQGVPTPDRPFFTETRTPEGESTRYESAVVVSYGVFEDNKLNRVALAGFKLAQLHALADRRLLDDDTHFAVINRRGEALFGGRGQKAQTRMTWIKAVGSEGRYEGQITRDDGTEREIFVVESGSDGLYVAVSRPNDTLWSWSKLNPFSSLLVPILAWLFGFTAIWLATDKLILVHLRKMRRAAADFSRGDFDRRIGDLDSPPQSIHSLGQSFDLMADKLSERDNIITDSLDEKENLLREIHHRVKNNLQIIISLLNMQERKLTDEQGLAAINETRSRIGAIALVHRGLYESADLRYVDMQVFLDRLTQELSVALGTKQRDITISTQADCEVMEADTATPVALFVVEALTNSIKHGVAAGGQINVTLSQNTDVVTVTVSDTGGSVSGDKKAIAGTGTKLIKGFARQLGGRVEIDNTDTDYTVSLIFKLRKV